MVNISRSKEGILSRFSGRIKHKLTGKEKWKAETRAKYAKKREKETTSIAERRKGRSAELSLQRRTRQASRIKRRAATSKRQSKTTLSMLQVKRKGTGLGRTKDRSYRQSKRGNRRRRALRRSS